MSIDRVLVDTNVVLSGVLYQGNEARVLDMALRAEVRLVLAEAVVFETRSVLANKFPEKQDEFERFLQRVEAEHIPYPDDMELGEATGRVRDPKDVPILASILASKPDVALTGDKDLLTDEVKAIVPTCTCAEYLQRLHLDSDG